MKTNYTICSILALAFLCFCCAARSQDEAVKMVLDILKQCDAILITSEEFREYIDINTSNIAFVNKFSHGFSHFR